MVGRPRSTIQAIIRRAMASETLHNKPQVVDRLSLAVDKRFLVRELKKNPRVSAPQLQVELQNRGVCASASTVRNACRGKGFHGRIARRKFFVSERNRKAWLAFAKKYQNESSEFWKKIIYSDESKFNLFGSDGKWMVWRKRNTELHPKNQSAAHSETWRKFCPCVGLYECIWCWQFNHNQWNYES